MRSHLWILPVLTAFFPAGGAEAGPILDLFSRKPKIDPTTRVPALIAALTTDKDERARQSAAEELPNYDPKQFTEISPALVHALQNDAAIAVRLSAVNALGRLRPVNQEAGYALEQAEANDASTKVRSAATATLRTYKVLGYTGGKSADPKLDQSEEPPLAPPYDKALRGKVPKSVGTAPVPAVPLKEASKPAIPVKAEAKREGLFALPSWLGGKEKEPVVVPPKPPVLPREPKTEKSVPIESTKVPEPTRVPSPEPAREESKGPSLEPPK